MRLPQQLMMSSLLVMGLTLPSTTAINCDDVTRNQTSPIVEVFNSTQPSLNYIKVEDEGHVDVHVRLLCHVKLPTWLVLTSGNTKVAQVLSTSRIALHAISASPEINVETPGDSVGDYVGYNVSSPVGELQTIRVRLRGHRLGKTELHVVLEQEAEDGTRTTLQPEQNGARCLLLVIRPNQKLDLIFTVIVSIMAFIYNISIGSKIDLAIVKKVLKRPVAPIIGLCCQFIIMPSVAYGVTQVMGLRQGLALGLFLVGCAPGGGASNLFTFLLNGDLNLSVCMTCISSFAALGMLPLWIFTLGRTFLKDSPIRIPYENMVITLAVLLLAIAIGLVIRYKRPKWAKILGKILKPMFIIFMLVMFTFGVYVNLHVFKLINGWIILCGALLPYTGFLLGGLVALALRRPWFQVYTIAIETGIQNGGVAFLILKYSLPQPDSDLAIVSPAAAMIMTPLPIWIIYIVYEIRKRCCVPKGRCLCPPCCDRPPEDDVDVKVEKEGMGEEEKFLPPLRTNGEQKTAEEPV